MALNSTLQDQHDGGMYRGKRAPGNAVYDALNLLITDEGNLQKRGGSAYKSNAGAGDTLVGLFDGYLAGGLRTLMWALTGGSKLAYLLGSDDATAASLTVSEQIDPLARGAIANGVLYLPCLQANASLFTWGGSRKAAEQIAAPTVTLTNGSTTMTGSGTTWSSEYEQGSVVVAQMAGFPLFTVSSVDSDTSITLSNPWDGATGSQTVAIYNHFNAAWNPPEPTATAPRLVAATGSPARVWSIIGNNRAYYTDRGGGNLLYEGNYIDIASASYIIGADSFRDELCLFSTDGIWTVANTSLDPVDDFGNIEWTQSQVSREFVLWGDPGIASYSGTLIVPGVDDVCLFTPSAQLETITGARGSKYDGGIRNLYRSYVTAGYQLGTATIYRSHYILPIVNGTTLVDVLVCRLDHGFAWTRWDGHAAGVAYARRAGATTRQPKLLGLAGQRVTDLTGCFNPTGSNTTDADGTIPTVQITTRDYPTGQQPGFVTKIRGRYELVADGIPYSLDRADQNLDGGDWRKDPFNQLDGPITITGNQYAGGAGENGYSSWLTTKSFTAPLAVKSIIQARPATNLDAAAFTALGLVQGPVISDDPFADHNPDGGYETRVRFESAHDTVTIERYDTNNRTRIAGPTNLGSRILPGDTFAFRVAADGTITVLINDVSVATATDTTYFHAGESAYIVVHITDQSTGGLQSAIRLDSSAVGVAVEYSSDADGGTWHDLTETGEQNGGTGWTISDGSLYQFAKVGKKREQIRFRFTLASACASFVWRSLEMLTRPSGKQ